MSNTFFPMYIKEIKKENNNILSKIFYLLNLFNFIWNTTLSSIHNNKECIGWISISNYLKYNKLHDNGYEWNTESGKFPSIPWSIFIKQLYEKNWNDDDTTMYSEYPKYPKEWVKKQAIFITEEILLSWDYFFLSKWSLAYIEKLNISKDHPLYIEWIEPCCAIFLNNLNAIHFSQRKSICPLLHL